tara:strand:+ start:692 stop:1144 length:453 start_codon:yes stop_codon:yes gene_type:complete
MQIYISKNGKQFGPYTKSQLYSHIQSGTFVSTDPAWWQGCLGWKTVDDVTFTVESVTDATSNPIPPLPTAIQPHQGQNPFPAPQYKDTKIRKVQIVKPGQLKDSADLPWSVRVERFFDKHNHKMEFFRTLFGLLTITLQLVILAKLFGYL